VRVNRSRHYEAPGRVYDLLSGPGRDSRTYTRDPPVLYQQIRPEYLCSRDERSIPDQHFTRNLLKKGGVILTAFFKKVAKLTPPMLYYVYQGISSNKKEPSHTL